MQARSNREGKSNQSIVSLAGISKVFGANQDRRVLSNLDLEVQRGKLTAIVGRSGSGKTTLLNIIAGIDRPDSGAVTIFDNLHGTDLGTLSEDARAQLRLSTMGIVFQFFNLLPTLSALDNVELPALIAGKGRGEFRKRAKECLELVGMASFFNSFPWQLSGGELQRVSIARSLVLSPILLLADEPTGNLDHQNRDGVFSLLKNLVESGKCSVLMVTHDLELAKAADTAVHLYDGKAVT